MFQELLLRERLLHRISFQGILHLPEYSDVLRSDSLEQAEECFRFFRSESHKQHLLPLLQGARLSAAYQLQGGDMYKGSILRGIMDILPEAALLL